MNSADFVDHALELMRPVVAAKAKRMFGGHGIFDDDRMFALIVDNVLYLRCAEGNRPAFDRLDLPPFDYARADGRRTVMSYRRAPDEALESPGEMREWVRGALAAARATPSPGAKAGKR